MTSFTFLGHAMYVIFSLCGYRVVKPISKDVNIKNALYLFMCALFAPFLKATRAVQNISNGSGFDQLLRWMQTLWA